MFWRAMLIAAMAVAMACAQGGMGGGEGAGGGGGMGGRAGGEGMGAGGGMRTPRQTPFDRFAEKLKLNKDQKTEAGTILVDAAKEMAPVEEKLLHLRQDLAGALINGVTGDALDQLTRSYAQLAAQVSGIQANTFAKVCKMIKPGQQKNAPEAFELLASIYDRVGTGGGRGGGRAGNRSGR